MGLHEELGYHKLTLTLLRASWRRAQRLIAERRSAIVRIAEVSGGLSVDMSGCALTDAAEGRALKGHASVERAAMAHALMRRALVVRALGGVF